MSVTLIVCGHQGYLPQITWDMLIGVDQGALVCAKNQHMMDVAVGDFDSVSDSEFALIQKMARQIIRLPKLKDQTDSEVALTLAPKDSSMIMTGALGGRIDHQLINIKLCSLNPNLQLWDQNHRIFSVVSSATIAKSELTYISLFPQVPSKISIRGVKYPLDQVMVDANDLYLVSNEIKSSHAILDVEHGCILVVLSKDS